MNGFMLVPRLNFTLFHAFRIDLHPIHSNTAIGLEPVGTKRPCADVTLKPILDFLKRTYIEETYA